MRGQYGHYRPIRGEYLPGLVHIHMLGGEDGQERLEDLQLDALISVRPREAGADGVHNHVNLPLGRVLHTHTGPGQVTIS